MIAATWVLIMSPFFVEEGQIVVTGFPSKQACELFFQRAVKARTLYYKKLQSSTMPAHVCVERS